MAAQAPNMDAFDAYFRRADLDQDGRISGAEAVAFLQGSNLPRHILAQIWAHANQKGTGYLGRPEFYNALKLVTVAQKGRELTPDIVKAALFGPAASKIPAPQISPLPANAAQINSVATSTPQLGTTALPSTQMGAMGSAAFQNLGVRGQQPLTNAGMNHLMRPPQATQSLASPPVQGGGQGLPGRDSVAGPRLPNSNAQNLSTDWFGGGSGGAPAAAASQVPFRGFAPLVNQAGFGVRPLGTAPELTPRPQTYSPTSLVQPKPLDPVFQSSQPAADSRALVSSGNGFSSDSVFGGDVFSANTRTKQGGPLPTFSDRSMPNTSNIVSVAAGSQNSTGPGQPDPLQNMLPLASSGSQLQRTQAPAKQTQLDTIQENSALAVSNVSVGPATSVSNQAQLPWPKVTQSNIQQYTAVFLKVDKDRDGKITGEEARNLFLSWRIPREVLKQVWDLSDQDNDSMLSLREFCTALYLMERFREGRPLPSVLPNSLKFDETLLLSTSQPSAAYSGPSWQQNPVGLSHQGIPGSRPVMPTARMKPPRQASVLSQTADAVQPVQQKARVPVLEKHLLNQLSSEEQSSLNSKFQEATDADKKVQELEKEILDYKEKIEFFRTKMQELILYKSRCDNRLNEITERVSADKREVELLAKRYEEKYKQSGDVASKLTLDEATFRDIQEKKLELYNAIVKMEQGGTADGVLQDRADRIQSDLNEVVKTLNERCKQYGLRSKPTSLIELPFGWQPGIQEAAADWDEDWDKFDDEGFAIVKELTMEVENVVAKPKPPVVQSDKTSSNKVPAVASSSNDDSKTEKPSSTGEHPTETESADARSEDESTRSPPGSARRSTLESSSQEFQSSQFGMHDISPRSKESHSDHGGAESTISRDKYADEPLWGAHFDSNDDADSTWHFNTINTKETDHERSGQDSFFGSEDFGLNPIRTGSPSAASVFGRDRRTPFFDSVPGTPMFNSGSSPRFSEGPEDHSFDSFSRFDSFSMTDSGFFPPSGSMTRFDSMRSTTDDSGLFPPRSLTRFDSMSSTTADPPLGSLARFDSIRSTTDYSRGFPSFDDADPFGSTGPFRSSESNTPRRGTDNWSAF